SCATPASPMCCLLSWAAPCSCAGLPATSCRPSPRRPPRPMPPNKRGAMADTLKARDAKDVESAVQWALAQTKSLEVVGHGTKRALGRPAQVDATLDLAALTGITLYEPEELVLSARAGTPLAEITAATDAKGQQLAFEPMDFGPLLGVA